MKTLRHPIVGLIFFVVLVSLCVTIYNGLEDKYDVAETGTQAINGTNGSIVDHLNSLSIVSSLNEFKDSVQKIVAPDSLQDILGGLAGAAVGTLKIMWSIFAFPIEIMGIILHFYVGIPPIIADGLGLIIFMYIAFIFISAYLRSDV